MSDPLIEHIKRKHTLVKKAAWEDPERRRALERDIDPDDTVEVTKRAKSSPLIDEIANRTRVPGAPSTQPLSGSGRDTGSPVPPAGGVTSREHSHDHIHDGLTSDPFEAARW